jgi:hypothetical protein
VAVVQHLRPEQNQYRTAAELLPISAWKLFHNPVLKGHGFSHAAKEQEDRGLYRLRKNP